MGVGRSRQRVVSGELHRALALAGVLDRIRVPTLNVRGAHDRQVPVDDALGTFADLVNSPQRELKIFTGRGGGVEHCGVGNVLVVRSYSADYGALEMASDSPTRPEASREKHDVPAARPIIVRSQHHHGVVSSRQRDGWVGRRTHPAGAPPTLLSRHAGRP